MTAIPEKLRTAEDPDVVTRTSLVVLSLCFLAVAAEGYDLIVYGASVLPLMYEPDWGMTTDMAGLIASCTLAGMMAGLVLSGHVTDLVGRRKVIAAGIVWFSVGSIACAFANSAEFLLAARIFTGVGIGAVIPPVVVLTAEFAPRHRRQLFTALMLIGFSAGGILASVVALKVLPEDMPAGSWRALFAIGGIFIVVAPIAYRFLPDSHEHLVHASMRETDGSEHAVVVHRGIRGLLHRRLRAAMIIFTVLCFCAQFSLYGLDTWLPELMHASGYPVAPSLEFFLILQVSAVVGMLVGALIADRIGTQPVLAAFFLLGALALVVLGLNVHALVLKLAVASTGLGTVGTTMLLYGYAATHFPAPCRATAVGVSMGIARTGSILGPLVGGWILGSELSHTWGFYAYAAPLAFAGLLVAWFGRRRTPAPEHQHA